MSNYYIGSGPIPEVLTQQLETLGVVALCHKLKEVSERTLPTGAGYAHATLINGRMQIWYSVSDMEYPVVGRHGIKLFATNSNPDAMTFTAASDTHAKLLGYIEERLCPAIQRFLTKELHWTPAP